MTYLGRGTRSALRTRVRAVTALSERVREIELTGPEVGRLRCRAGGHLVVQLPGGRRVYSVWRHDPAAATLVLRVVLHAGGGPGCEWARTVSVDDRVSVEPPRSKITLADGAAFHLFVGDETGGVPLLGMRAALPRTAAVFGVLETSVIGEEIPAVHSLPWVHRGTASAVGSRVLLRAVQELELPAGGRGAAYVAGESATCRLIQRHLVEQRGWPRSAVLVQQQWAPDRPGFGAGRD